jgi:preprotein translocase subunit YajC
MIIFIYLALLAVAFFFLIVRPQRRQMASRKALIARLEVGDDIITAGGIYGTIVEMSDTALVVEIAPHTQITLAREAVSGVQVPPESPSDELDLRSDADASDPVDGDPMVGDAEVGESPVGDRDPSAEDK